MPQVASTAHEMISRMTPEMRPEEFVFVSTKNSDVASALLPDAISLFREDEGISLIVPVAVAQKTNLGVDSPMRCITLNVFSSLEGVGLTAAVSTALGAHGIPCNMVAAHHHDHVFVPSQMGTHAMEILTSLQKQHVDDDGD